MNKLKYILLSAIGVVALVFGFSQGVFGGYISNDVPSGTPQSYQHYEFFASTTLTTVTPTVFATSTTATSTNITGFYDNLGRYNDGKFKIAGAKKVSVYFDRTTDPAVGNAGSSRFRVQVSPNGTDWYDWNKLVVNAATTTANITSLNAVTISAATSTDIVGLDLSANTFRFMRCIVLETTDGTHRCSASAEW